MENNTLGKYTVSFGLSLAITSVLSALLVVVKELSRPTVMAWMKQITFHHWVTHAIIDLIIFVALGLLLTKVKVTPKQLIQAIVGAVAISGSVIAGFFLMAG
ncbi:MAG: hypothetical protein WAW37_13140 [Syntrophobacteraceae bacterium]